MIPAALRWIVSTEPKKLKADQIYPIWTRFVSALTLNLTVLLRYLDLFVVADGSDRRGGVQRVLCAAGAELHHRLGPAHEARHRTPILDQLLLLLLREKQNELNEHIFKSIIFETVCDSR